MKMGSGIRAKKLRLFEILGVATTCCFYQKLISSDLSPSLIMLAWPFLQLFGIKRAVFEIGHGSRQRRISPLQDGFSKVSE